MNEWERNILRAHHPFKFNQEAAAYRQKAVHNKPLVAGEIKKETHITRNDEVKKKTLIAKIDEVKSKELKTNLMEFWSDKTFSDLTLSTADQVFFPVHKIIICSMSKYFHRMIVSGDWAESNKSLIQLDNSINSNDLKLVLDYMYGKDLNFFSELNWESVLSLYHLANFLIVNTLNDFMEKLLILKMSDENCSRLWQTGNDQFNTNLQKEAEKYIERNTKSFFNKHFQKLTPETFIRFLGLKDLNCTKRLLCINALKWIKQDISVRQKYIRNIFDVIKFKDLPRRFIAENLLNDEVFYKNEYFVGVILDEFKSKLIEEMDNEEEVDDE